MAAPSPGRRPAGSRSSGSGSSRRSPTGRRTSRPATVAAREPNAGAERSKLTGRALILAVVLAVLVVSYASSMRAWLQQRSELATLQSQIAERRTAVKALSSEIQRWKDPAYVEAQARARFGWVMPGEIGYRVIGANGKPLRAPHMLGKPATRSDTPRDWWNGLWGSVRAAGHEPTRPDGDRHGWSYEPVLGPQRPPSLSPQGQVR